MPYTEEKQLNAAGVFGLFEHAITHSLKYPKIRLRLTDGEPVVLSRAGAKSKYTGQVMVTDGGSFGANRYYGRIDAQGIFHATDSAKPPVFDLLARLGSNPVEVAKEHGRLTGQCCFCGLPLKDARSTANGYGPICAKHYGLMWDATEHAHASEPAQEVQPEANAKRITLHIEVNGLISAHITGGDETRIRELFGSNVIPTPFTFHGVKDVEHFAARVIANIREANAGVDVQWSPDRCAEFVAFKFAMEVA